MKRFLSQSFLAYLTLFVSLACCSHVARAQAETPEKWQPELYFGTVNFNEQLTQLEQWRQTAARTDGMLLHVHYFVRHMDTPRNQKLAGVEATIREIAPVLRGKSNLFELTYDIRSADSSPEEIARMHAQNIETIEAAGVAVSTVNVDWILGGFDVQMKQTPRLTDESEADYFTRLLQGVLAKSARYVAALRAVGRDEKLIAVFPPIYIDEGPWINARKKMRPGISSSRILNGIFDIGFDGFTADSPYFVMSNADYRAAGYFDALRSIEQTCRKRGKSFGFILNGDNDKDGAAYDAQFRQNTLSALDLMREANVRPDQIIVESWYKGPFELVPETQANTLTNTVLQVADALDKAKN